MSGSHGLCGSSLISEAVAPLASAEDLRRSSVPDMPPDSPTEEEDGLGESQLDAGNVTSDGPEVPELVPAAGLAPAPARRLSEHE